MNNWQTKETLVISSNIVIRIEELGRHFLSGPKPVVALNHVSLELPRGQMIALRGPSGCGKSTLLNLLGSLDRPTEGKITVDGIDVARLQGHAEVEYRRSKVGFIFQSFNLVPYLTAVENVTLPMEFTSRSAREREERARQLLKQVGIDHDRQAHRPSRLSGGQQQRVAIARALANAPSLLLADEPTANLDSSTGSQILELLVELAANGQTVVVATHDPGVAARANMIVEMQDGRVVGMS
jgi:putative ABC transport system ATP-binding protein